MDEKLIADSKTSPRATNRTDPDGAHRTSAVVVVAGLMALFAGSWLGSENVALRAALAESRPSRNDSVPAILRAGSILPNVEVIDLTSDTEDPAVTGPLYERLGGASVLFLYTSTCPFCARSFPVAPTLNERLHSLSVDLVGVAVDGRLPVADGLDARMGGYPMLALADDSAARSLGVEVVPTFVLVGQDFNIVEVWTGELTAAQVGAIVQSVRVANAGRE